MAARLRQAQAPRDIGTTGTADCHDLGHDFPGICAQIVDRQIARIRIGIHAHRAAYEGTKILRLRTKQLEIMLQLAVVADKHLADPSGIAAASQILEQDGIIDIAQHLTLQSQRHGDMSANPAGTDTVTSGLPLGQVEGIGEGTKNFRQA